jgi:ABC-type uncharacterized transport system permease subunit
MEIKKNYEFIYANFYILYKTLLEYKANVLVQIITQFIYLISHLLFFKILTQTFEIKNWTTFDLFFYLFLIDFIFVFNGIFTWKRGLKYEIINGDLNVKLTKPINTFIFYQFSKLNSGALTQLLTSIFILIFLVLFYDVSGYFLSLNLCILLFLTIFLVFTFKIFVDSINFFSFGLSKFFDFAFVHECQKVIGRFPAPFFKQFPYKIILFIFPIYFSWNYKIVLFYKKEGN